MSWAGSSEPVRARTCSVRAASTAATASADRSRRNVDRLADRHAALPIAGHHADLEGQQLVEPEPAQGGVAQLEGVRVVGVLERGGDGHRSGPAAPAPAADAESPLAAAAASGGRYSSYAAPTASSAWRIARRSVAAVNPAVSR